MELLDKYFEKVVKDKIVVDLGCANYGVYCERGSILKKQSKKWYGGDIDRKYLKANSDNKNLFFCDLNQLDFFNKFPKNVDLISLIEVIEHLQSPYHTIKYLCDNKKPETELLISTPNGVSFGKVLYGFTSRKKLMVQDIKHYYVFNEQTLENLCTDAGLKKFRIISYTRTELMRSILRFLPNLASGFLVHGK